jgi:hypothetical protein
MWDGSFLRWTVEFFRPYITGISVLTILAWAALVYNSGWDEAFSHNTLREFAFIIIPAFAVVVLHYAVIVLWKLIRAIVSSEFN